ncbi:hypothetical protein Slin15195_G042580 [Septoria linicola]|uniref:Uncharacterized protein n=1 Tax=Septoria linicola TaxID=215465 RepID=A0A9Q9EIC1_9PEZI|nr:hypothetical protein Slin14017_G046100 [Septoria linicola]USW50939.1 hypothetical protein Slin15195_G042580 [Septoria linicola]
MPPHQPKHKPTSTTSTKTPLRTYLQINPNNMRFHLTAIFAATTALAAPLSLGTTQDRTELTPRSTAIPVNTSSCSGYNNAFWNINQSAFSITIGRPYLDGSKCDLVKDKITRSFKVQGFKCQGASDKKNTVLKIKSNMNAANLAKVNKALHDAYPEIQFNCPTSLRK